MRSKCKQECLKTENENVENVFTAKCETPPREAQTVGDGSERGLGHHQEKRLHRLDHRQTTLQLCGGVLPHRHEEDHRPGLG